ncbi:hypothetical protein Goarm_004087, partial [Gossypium armourianum]|nr:hypothetical protein [Gossypium armourianum]
MIIGSTDTTSTTMEWAMTELLRHPNKLRRVTEELDAIIGDQTSVEDETTIVAGYTIPKNSNIFFNVWAIQRDAEFWEDPLRFEPERFLKDTEKRNYTGNCFHFFPFGSGRRICVGIPLAEKIMMQILATLLHCFKWELPNGRKPDVKEKLQLVLSKAEPLVVVPIARWIKINCDGALDVKNGKADVGVICRDCRGMVLDGATERVIADEAEVVEAMTVTKGVEFA